MPQLVATCVRFRLIVCACMQLVRANNDCWQLTHTHTHTHTCTHTHWILVITVTHGFQVTCCPGSFRQVLLWCDHHIRAKQCMPWQPWHSENIIAKQIKQVHWTAPFGPFSSNFSSGLWCSWLRALWILRRPGSNRTRTYSRTIYQPQHEITTASVQFGSFKKCFGDLIERQKSRTHVRICTWDLLHGWIVTRIWIAYQMVPTNRWTLVSWRHCMQTPDCDFSFIHNFGGLVECYD